jgi:hypothetical protein
VTVIMDAIRRFGDYWHLDPVAVGILLLLPLGILHTRYRYNKDVLAGSRSLPRLRASLEARDWRSAYFGMLQRRLSWVDGKLGQSAWSADSYEFTLTMAFVYPFASLLIVWLVTGRNTSGIADLLPEQVAFWRQTLVLLSIGMCAHASYHFTRCQSRRGFRYFAFAWVFAFAISMAFAGPASIAMVVAVAFAVAFDVAIAIAMAVVVAVAGAAASAAAGVVAAANAVAVAVAIALAFVRGAMDRRGLNGVFFFLLSLLMLGLLAIAISHPGWFQEHVELPHFIFLFLILLPIINSVFDWLSLAATRALLKELSVSCDAPALRVASNAALGVFLGLLLLAGLAVTATAGLQTANLLSQSNGGPEYIDLTGLLWRLHHNPGNPAVWWVYFTLFSTMFPTAFHAAIASASFVVWRLPESWKRHWLTLLDDNIKDDPPVLIGMAWRLTLMEGATVVLAVLAAGVLAVLVWLIVREGMWLLWLCERVAEWLGAPIQI